MDIVIKNPEIDKLDKDSPKYKMYIRLYQSFFSVQTQKSPSEPFGIEEGDNVSIRMHNTAFNLADIITDSIDYSNETNGIDVSEFLKKSGDSMVGHLNALNGFSAGIDGTKIINIFKDKEGYSGVDVAGVVRVDGDLMLNGKDVISRVAQTSTTIISDDNVVISGKKVTLPANTTIGDIAFENGEIVAKDKKYYHNKNSNLSTVDWDSKNSNISKDLKVGNKTETKKIDISESIDFADVMLADKVNGITFFKDLNLKESLFLQGKKALWVSESGLSLGYDGGNLILGNSNTKEIRLASSLKNWNGTKEIISNSGKGTFNGFSATHDSSSDVLIKTYQDKDKKGIIVNEYLWLGDDKNVSLLAQGGLLKIQSFGDFLSFKVDKSNSFYKPQNKDSKTYFIDSNTDFISFLKPIEGKTLGISESQTKLSDGIIILSNDAKIEAIKDGSFYHGYVKFDNDISSEKYSTGYSGYGWGIQTNKVSGVTSMSIDEVTVRKKMRIYELEVNKETATNGSLWVTDSLKADIVEQLI